jgi:hypothetical protein
MRYTHWLRRQVERLETEIREHSVFTSNTPATPAELRELRTKSVIHTFLKQQLLRREPIQQEEPEVDTQEFVLVRR